MSPQTCLPSIPHFFRTIASSEQEAASTLGSVLESVSRCLLSLTQALGRSMRLVSVIAILVSAAGCDSRPSISKQIQAAGGMAALKRDCQLYFAGSERPNHKAWVMGNTSDLPPTIAALRPQIVDADQRDAPLVNIQFTGGFRHHGLLVCVSNTPPGFQPPMKWRVSRIADGVFEYHE